MEGRRMEVDWASEGELNGLAQLPVREIRRKGIVREWKSKTISFKETVKRRHSCDNEMYNVNTQ